MSTTDDVTMLAGEFPYSGRLIIRPTMGLDAGQRLVERELATLVQDQTLADVAYDKLNGTQQGCVINIDYYRCLHGAYGDLDPATVRQRRTLLTPATYAPAKKAAQDRFRRAIMTPFDDVIIMGGGPASGKSTAVAASQVSKGVGSNTLTYDTSLADPQEACEDIRAVLAFQNKVMLLWVYRPFPLAMVSMIERALRDGRYLTARRLAVTHTGSRAAILRIAKEFSTDHRVAVLAIDNSGANGKAHTMDLRTLEDTLIGTANEVTADIGLRELNAYSQSHDLPKDLYDAIAR